MADHTQVAQLEALVRQTTSERDKLLASIKAAESELAQIAAGAAGTHVVFDLPDELEQKGFGKAKDSVLCADKLTALGYVPAYSAEKGITVSVSIIHDLEFAGPQS